MWQNRAILNHYKTAISQKNDNLKFYMDPNSITDIYILIHNINGEQNEFVGGEYIVHMKLPNNFPFSPPVFKFLTPQGICEINVPVCIDIGHFHPENYRPVLGIYGFAMNLCSFMLSDQLDGINIIKTDIMKKKQFALESKEYNEKNHKTIIDNLKFT